MQKNPRLEWSDGARADLLAIVDHISDDNPQAAQDLKDEIEANVNDLPAFPEKNVPPDLRGFRPPSTP
jgi:plasmid stabilization system protein ParE